MQWKHFLVTCELDNTSLIMSSNASKGQLAKNHKERPFFEADSFVAATVLVSPMVKIRKFKMLYFQNEKCYSN